MSRGFGVLFIPGKILTCWDFSSSAGIQESSMPHVLETTTCCSVHEETSGEVYSVEATEHWNEDALLVPGSCHVNNIGSNVQWATNIGAFADVSQQHEPRAFIIGLIV
jgi:hypothetical protein